MERCLKVRGIALLDGKLLCVQLTPYNNLTAVSEPFWCLPGGTVEEGEAIIDAFRREMVEEMGIDPRVGRLLFVQQFSAKATDYLEFFFHIENPEDYTNVDLANTSHGAQEIQALDFVDPRAVHVLPKFLASENLDEFIANNQPTKFFANY